MLLKGRAVRDIALPLFNNNQELEELLHHVDALKPCEGATLGTHGKECRAWVAKKAERCTACKNMYKNLNKKENRAITKTKNLQKNSKKPHAYKCQKGLQGERYMHYKIEH